MSIKYEDYELELLEDSTFCIKKYNGNKKEIFLPDQYRGIEIAEIGRNAFCQNKELEYVYIPNGIKNIKDSAFYGCEQLKSIDIPASVNNIDICAFSFCPSVEFIHVDSDNERYYSKNNCIIDYMLRKVVVGCKNSTIPTEVAAIGNHAFNGCVTLEEIKIPKNVIYIGELAFFNCINLNEIYIHKDIMKIGDGAFAGCISLKNIMIEKENEQYFINGNCIIDRKTGTVIFGCVDSTIPMTKDVKKIGRFAFFNCYNLEEITIPDNITSVGEFAFDSCKNLKEIELPEFMNKIGYCAFHGCQQLVEITIPSRVKEIAFGTFARCIRLQKITIPLSVERISRSAFRRCNNLKSIDFDGRIDDWEQIDKNLKWDEYTEIETIECIDGNISIK